MSRYPANIITKSPATPTGPNPLTGRAPGIWRMEDVAYWLKQGVWPDASADAYWPYTSLLLSSTSLSNANNNLFVDSSGAFNPVSRNGNTTQGSFTPYGSYWSNYFDGTTGYLTAASNAVFAVPAEYTVEFWAYQVASPTSYASYFLVNVSNGLQIGFNTGGGGTFGVANNLIGWQLTTAAFPLNQWTHIAVTRDSSNVTRIFYNGVQQTSGTIATSYAQGELRICNSGANNGFINGYVSNMRYLKGTALYTSTFTPPAAPLTAISGTSLLTCQSNRFIDNSSNAFAITVNGDTKVQKFSPFTLAAPGVSYNQSDITNWSGYFDGSGDYLTTTNTNFTGDATVECWLYVNSLANPFQIFGTNNGASDGKWIGAYVNTSGSILGTYGAGGGGGYYQSANGVVATGRWMHIAWVKYGSNVYVYVNGTQVATCSSAAGYAYNATPLIIGRLDGNNAYCLNGMISNLRMVNGTALYTSSFTPPTSPLTAVSGTCLLTLQNAAFTDNSTNNFVITPYGNTTVSGNSPFNTTGYWGNYFDGTSNQSLSVANNTALDLPSGTSFTIEGWIFPTRPNNGAQSGFRNIVSKRTAVSLLSNYNIMLWYNSEKIGFYNGATSSLSANSVTLNTWTHFAYVYDGSTSLKLYLNGTLDTNFTTTPGVTNSAPVTIGSLVDDTGTNDNFGGYISNIRIVKGSQVYTGNFTVPTTPLTAVSGTSLLTCQNGSFKDNSSNAFTVTPANSASVQAYNPFYTSTIASNGGSMYFDGSGDYLTMPSSAAFQVGTGQFTLECWIYFNTVTNINEFLWADNSGVTGGRLVMYYSGGSLQIVASGGAGATTASWTPVAGQWYHLAASRDASNNQRLFVNGALLATATSTNDYTQNGFAVARAASLNGYMAGIRLVKGTALYTAAFTPPTAPVTPTAATTLLVNGMNAGIYDATTINDMETVGNAQVSTVQSKFGGSSMYFDGSGDYLSVPSAPSLIFNGSFTIEFWVNFSSLPTGYIVLTVGTTANTQLFITTKANGTGLRFGLSYVAEYAAATQTWATGTWYHVALVRNGTDVKFYVNGTNVSDGTYTNSTTYSGALLVGGTAPSTYDFNGYIDDLRITKGVARYTSNFTPPTQAFPVY